MCPNSDDTVTKAHASCYGTNFSLSVHPILILGVSLTVNFLLNYYNYFNICEICYKIGFWFVCFFR